MRWWATSVALFLGIILIPFLLFEKASNAEVEEFAERGCFED